MKNIFSIFISDIKALSKRFFAMAIVIAICFIPALYAWFNIFSNWDPYGSTGNIKIAVASEDLGYTDQDGVYVNKGEAVLEQLKTKDSIDFVIYDNTWDALDAMESGKCYGAIIIRKHFTENMYNLSSALTNENETITFYENAKLNAVANKITETAASTVAQSVQTEYLEVLFETIFGKIADALDSDTIEETGNKAIDVITRLRNTTSSLSTTIGSFMGSSGKFAGALAGVTTGDTVTYITNAQGDLSATQQNLDSVRNSYRDLAKSTTQNINDLIKYIDAILAGQTISYNADNNMTVSAASGQIAGAFDSYSNVSPALSQEGTQLIQAVQNNSLLAVDSNTDYQRQLLKTMRDDLVRLKDIQSGSMDAAIEQYFDLLTNLTANLNPVLVSMGKAVASIDPTMQAASQTVYALDDTMGYVKQGMDTLTKRLDDLLEKVEAIQDSDTLNTIIDMLGGDSKKFAEFFACPVTVSTEALFPVANYGTAMTPFYSTLAIWVGCVVLVAVIKTEAEPRKLKNVTINQLYWARYILILILSEIQTLVIVLGDLLLLGVTCQDPLGFVFAGVVTSFVFVSFIFSMVISFGDIGKAIVVVIMVLEIAGSSGTYPIEILQEEFITLYRLFPFPYAINAMREAICGYYMFDYWAYLGKLTIFGVIGLLIGLFVRHPFVKINEYIEEEMEESGIL